MSEQQNIRDELAIVVGESRRPMRATNYSVTDAILASPVIRRIQAEALRDMAERVRREWFPHTCPWVGYVDDEAARIEKGD